MPKGLLQEKFQVTAKPRPKHEKEWTSFESQRVTHAIPEGRIDTSEAKKRTVLGGIDAAIDYPKSNRLPPGQEIEDQFLIRKETPPYSAAGATDVSKMTTVTGMRNGFTRIPMRPTDDLYNNEHTEEFYGEATGSDETGENYTGFVERNNYLDRT